MAEHQTKRRRFIKAGLGLGLLAASGFVSSASITGKAKKGNTMLKIRRANERGLAQHGWLTSRHTFSFAEYYDPTHMNFMSLRVINEDRIAGGTGFDAHPHRDMEIISYVIDGELQHQDSLGNKAVIRPGEVQRMSAGTGVVHAEYNNLANKETHFLQIWIMPEKKGIKPGYGQKSFLTELEREPLVLVTSKDGRDGSISINQDADIYISKLKNHSSLHFGVRPGRGVWIQMVKGTAEVLGEELQPGDGAAILDEQVIELVGSKETEFILFDLPAA